MTPHEVVLKVEELCRLSAKRAVLDHSDSWSSMKIKSIDARIEEKKKEFVDALSELFS